MRKREINTERSSGAISRFVLLAAVLLTAVGCSPKLRDRSYVETNPVEILERSPRIYTIKFEEIADSIETIRASTYLAGSIGAVDLSGQGDTTTSGLSARDTAILEYNRADRRSEAGAVGQALEHLRTAMKADPTFRPPYILLGNLLLGQGRLEEALGLFSKLVSWDVTDSEALIGLARCYMFAGNLELAKKALVDAIIFDRANLTAWSELHAIGHVQKFAIEDHDLPVFGLAREVRGRHYDIIIDESLEDCPSQTTAWIVFASERAVWRWEGKFKHYTGETKYVPTYEEDMNCYMALAAAWQVLSESDSSACDREYLDHISRVAEDGYLVPHVLFDYVCLEHPFAARLFSNEVIEKLRGYINTYVLVTKG